MIAEETRSSRSTDFGRWSMSRSTTYLTSGAYLLSAISFFRSLRFFDRGDRLCSEFSTEDVPMVFGLPLYRWPRGRVSARAERHASYQRRSAVRMRIHPVAHPAAETIANAVAARTVRRGQDVWD